MYSRQVQNETNRMGASRRIIVRVGSPDADKPPAGGLYIWWRRGESNPRPEIQRGGLYERVRRFSFAPPVLDGLRGALLSH